MLFPFVAVGGWLIAHVIAGPYTFTASAVDTCNECYIDVTDAELHYWATSVIEDNMWGTATVWEVSFEPYLDCP